MKRDPFTAIADPTRREIIELLSKQTLNVNQVADHFEDVSRQAVSKQLKYLEESGLISVEKEGRERYCYLSLDNLDEVNVWLKRYERFWNKKLDDLGSYLKKKHSR